MKNNLKTDWIKTGLGLLLTGCLMGCSSSEGPEAWETEQGTEEMRVFTKAEGKAVNDKAGLLFWSETEINRWLSEVESPRPRPLNQGKAISLQHQIDYYAFKEGKAFSTGLEYALNENDYYYATGYSPYDGLEFADPQTGNYETLKVAEGFRQGNVDFMFCDARLEHRGSSGDRFTEEEHELKFRHLTSRIRFVALRDPVMYGVISVNNVKVTLQPHYQAEGREQGLYVPTTLTRHVKTEEQLPADNTSYLPDPDGSGKGRMGTYVASGMTKLTEPLVIQTATSDYVPANEGGLDVGACYVVSQQLPEGYDPFVEPSEGTETTLTFTLDIEADYSYFYADRTPEWFHRPEWPEKKANVTTKLGAVLYPGYEYIIYLKFKRESVTLQGIQKGWEEGGIHYLPIYPEKQESAR